MLLWLVFTDEAWKQNYKLTISHSKHTPLLKESLGFIDNIHIDY